MNRFLAELLDAAQQQPDHKIQFRDEVGRVVLTVESHTHAPVRPKDMPRHLRPKAKLSKRQRVAARREKFERETVAA